MGQPSSGTGEGQEAVTVVKINREALCFLSWPSAGPEACLRAATRAVERLSLYMGVVWTDVHHPAIH